MLSGGSKVFQVTFSAGASDQTTWFSLSNIITGDTTYSDLYPGQTANYFSVTGYSLYSYIICSSSIGGTRHIHFFC